jgi:hypothetical protein
VDSFIPPENKGFLNQDWFCDFGKQSLCQGINIRNGAFLSPIRTEYEAFPLPEWLAFIAGRNQKMKKGGKFFPDRKNFRDSGCLNNTNEIVRPRLGA